MWGPVGVAVSVIALGVSALFFIASIKSPHITVEVDPIRAVVLDVDSATELRAFWKDDEVTTDLTIVTLRFWNAGRAPVRRSDILGPGYGVITVSSGAKLLSATLTETSRPEAAFAVRIASDSRVEFDWDVLETNDGAEVQLLVAGSTDADVTSSITVIGQAKIDVHTPDSQKFFPMLLAFGSMGIGPILVNFGARKVLGKGPANIGRFIIFLVLLMGSMMLGPLALRQIAPTLIVHRPSWAIGQ